MKATGFVDFATDLDNPILEDGRGRRLLGCRGEAEQVRRMSARHSARWSALVEVLVIGGARDASRRSVSSRRPVRHIHDQAVLSGRGDEIIDLARTNLWLDLGHDCADTSLCEMLHRSPAGRTPRVERSQRDPRRPSASWHSATSHGNMTATSLFLAVCCRGTPGISSPAASRRWPHS